MTSPRPEWMREAWCARVPDLPWRTDTHRLPRYLVRNMAAICAACPVRGACAAYVEENDVTGGFWAGLDRALPDVWVDQILPGLADRDSGGDAA